MNNQEMATSSLGALLKEKMMGLDSDDPENSVTSTTTNRSLINRNFYPSPGNSSLMEGLSGVGVKRRCFLSLIAGA